MGTNLPQDRGRSSDLTIQPPALEIHAPSARNLALVMGRIALTRQPFQVTFDRAGLDISRKPDTPELTGMIKNRTGRPLRILSICIRNKGAGSGPPPRGDRVTVAVGDRKSSARFTRITRPGSPNVEYRALIDLTQGSKPAGDLGPDHEATIDIELGDAGSEPPTDFEVLLTGRQRALRRIR